MGYRLHCATKYEVEYSGGRFNHKCEEFHDLLQACDATYTGESCDNEFEVTKTEWKKAIDNLRNLDNLEEEEQENIKNALKWMTDSREEIIEDMEYLLSKADPSHDFLHLSFYQAYGNQTHNRYVKIHLAYPHFRPLHTNVMGYRLG